MVACETLIFQPCLGQRRAAGACRTQIRPGLDPQIAANLAVDPEFLARNEDQ
jgi:hypothetical protein